MSATESDMENRVTNSKDVLGHPHNKTGPDEWVEERRKEGKIPAVEGEDYMVLASTMWGDYNVPTIIKWAHGETDTLTDKEESLKNREKAKKAIENGESVL